MTIVLLLAPALVFLALLPQPVLAQAMQVICTGLAGCNNGPENTIYTNILPMLAALGIQIAAGGSVIFIIFSGARMLLPYGDDSKAEAGKKGIGLALGGLALALTSASIVSFVTTENFGQNNRVDFLFGGGGLLDSVVRICVFLFNIGFAIMAVLGGYRMMTASGAPDEFKKGANVIKWAAVGAVIVNLARALVQAFLQLNL